MGQTTNGAPWPDGTEPVRDGDNAIRALAEWVDPRTPYKVYALSGGWTTNAQGGIDIPCPFQVILLGLAQLVGTGSIAFQRASGAPAGHAWINAYNTASGAPVANVFMAADMIIMGT